MAFQLPKLPYGDSELAPTLSKETFSYHYGKHHKAYIDKMNELIAPTAMKDASLEEIVRKSEGALFNNAAQAWNHTFFWNCLTGKAEEKMASSGLQQAVEKKFGSTSAFMEQFVTQGVGNFGSGWTWLVRQGSGDLAIVNTKNAETPITGKDIPLLVVDVWEHAYYIDYRNERKRFIETLGSVFNWKFASERFDSGEVFSATKLMRA